MSEHEADRGLYMRPDGGQPFAVARHKEMVPGAGCDIGSEICVTDMVAGIGFFAGKALLLVVEGHSRTKLAPPRAVLQLGVGQIAEGAACMFDLAEYRQAHRGFGMVPRVDDPAVVPGDGAILPLQLENACTRSEKEVLRNRIAPGQMGHGHAAPFVK